MRTRFTRLLLVVLASIATLEVRADLALRVTPNPISIAQGGNGDVTLLAEPLEGFPGEAHSIEFTLKDFSAGTGVGSARTYLPAQPANLKIVVNSDTAPGTYPVTVSAVVKDAGGAVIGDKDFPDAFTVNVTAASCDFQVTATPQSFRILPGGTAMLRVSASLSGGCGGDFTFSATVPPGMTVDGPHTTQAPNTTVTFNYAAEASMPGGGQTSEIRIEGGGTSKSITVPFDVKAAAPKIALELPPAIELKAGESFTLPLMLQAENFNGPVQIQTKAPAGVTIEPSSLTIQPGQPQPVNVQVAPDAQPLAPGADLLYVTAQATAGGTLVHKQYQVRVQITPGAAADAPVRFATDLSPREVEIKPGETGAFTFTVRQTEGAPGALKVVTAVMVESDPGAGGLGIASLEPAAGAFSLTPGTPQVVRATVASYAQPGRYRFRWRLVPHRPDGSTVDPEAFEEGVVIVPQTAAPMTELEVTVDPREAALDPTGIPTVYTVNVRAPAGETVDNESFDVMNVSLGTIERTVNGDVTTFKIPISGLINAPQPLTFKFVSRPNYLRGSVTATALPGNRSIAVEVNPFDVSLWPGEGRTMSVGVREVKGVYKLQIEAVSPSPDVKVSMLQSEMLSPFTGTVEMGVEVAPGAQGKTHTVQLHFRDPNAGPTPVLVRTVPVEIKVRHLNGDVRIESGRIELQRGESGKVRIAVEGKDGWGGPAVLVLEPNEGIAVEPRMVEIPTLPGSAEVTVSVAQNATAGSVSTRILLRRPGADWNIKNKNFTTHIVGPPAEFRLSAIPSSLAIQAGSFEKFTVLLERGNAWNGAVDVKIGGNDRVVVEPKQFRIEEGQKSVEIKVSVPAETSATEGGEPSLLVTGRPVGGGEPEREAAVAIKVNAVPRTAAFSINSTHEDVWIFASDPARFKVFASGEGDWKGKVRVTARYEHAQPELAGRPDSEIVIEPRTFTLDTSDPQAQSREVVVSTGPQFSFRRDDMSNSGKYGAYTTKGYRVIFDATPEGGGEPKAVTVRLGTRPFPKEARVIELSGPTDPITIARMGRTQFSVELRSLLSSPVAANFTARHSSLTITPAQAWGHSRERSMVTFTVEAGPGYSGGNEPIVVEALPEGGENEQIEKLIVPVQTPRGSGKGGRPADDLDGESPLVPGEPVPAVAFPGLVEGAAFASVAQIERTRGYLEDISTALQATSQLYDDREQYDLALGFAQAFDALLNELRNATPLQVRANEPAIDSVLAARLLERGLVAGTHRPEFQTASLAPHGLFAGYIDAEAAELMADIRQGRVNWKEMARKLEPHEILIQQMRAANQSKQIDVALTIANETLADVNARISEKRLDQVPLPQAQIAVKSLALTAAAVATLDLVSKASIALMPSRVADLYSTVGNVKAHSILVAAGENPRISLNQPAELAVWMTGQARGGNVARPTEIVKQIAIPLWAAWGLRGKGKKPDTNDGPSSQDANRDGQPDWASQEAFEAYLWSELYNRLSMIPVLGQWAGQLGRKIDGAFTIKPYKTGPFRINSDKVVTFNIDNRSKEILEFSQQGNQPFITGRRTTAPHEEAGYWYGLKGWLIRELGQSTDGVALNRKGVVEVIAQGPYTDCEEARQEYQVKVCGNEGTGRSKTPPRDAQCRFDGVKCSCECVAKLF